MRSSGTGGRPPPPLGFRRARRPATFALGIERGQALHQPRPRHHRFHVRQKFVAPRLLLLAGVFRLGKAALPLHRSAPPRTRQILPNPPPKTGLFQHLLSTASSKARVYYSRMKT